MQQTAFQQLNSYILVILASCCILLGVVTIFAWYLKLFALIQWSDTLPPMQFNTAMGFVLTGFGLLAGNNGLTRILHICGALTFAIGFTNTAQYILNADFGIDQLLVDAYPVTGKSIPGRMAFSTAISFMLLGIGLLLPVKISLQRNFLKFLALGCGGLVSAFAVSFLIGYLTGIDAIYTWLQSSKVAPQSNIGFFLAGYGLLLIHFRTQASSSVNNISILSVLPTLLICVVTLLIWHGLRAHYDQMALEEMMLKTKNISRQIDAAIQERLRAMERMALRMENTQLTRREWEADANAYYRDFPAYQSIEWADANAVTRWGISETEIKELTGFDLNKNIVIRQIITAAQQNPEIVISRPVMLPHAGESIIAVRTLRSGTHITGYLLNVYQINTLFNHLLQSADTSNMAVTILRNDVILYFSLKSRTQVVNDKHYLVHPLKYLPGWEIKFTQFKLETDTALPMVVLVSGLGTALLVGIAIWYWQLAALRAKEILQTANTIAEQAMRLNSIVDTIVDGIITINADGIIESYNTSAANIFGYGPSEVIGRNVSLLMPEPDSSRHDRYLKNHQDGGPAGIIGIGREVVGKRKDGSLFPMDLAVNEMWIRHQRKYTGIVRDITRRKQAEQGMLDAKNEAELSNQAKSRFLAQMSHELRTPLNAILGFSQLMQIDSDLTAGQKDNVGEIYKAGKHLLELINEILDLSRIESGKVNLQIEEVGLQFILDECIHMVAPLESQYGISIMPFTLPAPSDLQVYADSTRLKQVIINLLSNAIKYNYRGGQVRLECHLLENQRVRINVIDTGYGIQEDIQQELFKPFTRFHNDNTGIEGTGIGLSISKQLIELMHGSIGISSAPGKGSTFWIELQQATHNTLQVATS